jgi:hypothetical protein
VDFVAVVDQVTTLLRQRGRVAYRTRKRQFQLDDEAVEDLKIARIESQRLAMDEHGSVLVWTGPARTSLSGVGQQRFIRGSLWPGRSICSSCHRG